MSFLESVASHGTHQNGVYDQKFQGKPIPSIAVFTKSASHVRGAAQASIKPTFWSKTAEFSQRFFSGTLGAFPLFFTISLVRSLGAMPDAAECYKLGLYTSGIGLLSALVTSHPKNSFYRGMQLSAATAAGALIIEGLSGKMADQSGTTSPPVSPTTTLMPMSGPTSSPASPTTTQMPTCNEYDNPAWQPEMTRCPILSIPYEQLKLHSYNNKTLWISSCIKMDPQSGEFQITERVSEISGMTHVSSQNTKLRCMFHDVETPDTIVLSRNW